MKPRAVASLIAVVAWSQCLAGDPITWRTDSTVLTAALVHFAKSKESAQYNPDGYIGIAPRTEPLSSSWNDTEYRRTFATLKHPPPSSALTSYLERNRQSYPIGDLPTPDHSLRIEKREHPLDDVITQTPPFRNFVYLKVPGYSSDGAYAFVTFGFLWSIHSAEARYVLKRVGESWVVLTTEYWYAV